MSDSLTDDFKQILGQAETAFKETIQSLQNEIVGESPVDTGRFKTSWEILDFDVKTFTFQMENNIPYALELWYGGNSKKGWGEFGGRPILDKHDDMLQDKFKNIRIT